MPFSQQGFDPETIALLESCLDQAVTLAATRVRIGEGLRHMLAAALIEGYDQYELREREALMVFALRALPAFRDKDPQLPAGT